MNNVFYWCVQFLASIASLIGMTYEEINVWIFCIIEPIIFLLMCIWLYYLLVRIYFLKIKLKEFKIVPEN